MGSIGIVVEPASYLSHNQRLFAALEALYPIRFLAPDAPDANAKGALLIGATRAEAESRVRDGLSCLLAPSESGSGDRRTSRRIRFGDTNVIPPLLRKRYLKEHRASPYVAEVRPTFGDIVVASHDTTPVWICHPEAAGAGALHVVALPLPILGPSCALHQYFNRDQFLGALPLLHFVRELTKAVDWSPPSLRACLVLDDVNLRRDTYGCIDFRALAQSAHSRQYHASVALIPLDASRVGYETAAMFRTHAECLSILIHGNNHINFELAREYTPAQQTAILAEARRRMLRLTDRMQLPVCTVAEPPYGVLRSSFLPALIALGYEAAVCTIRHYLNYNPAAADSLTFGMRAAESLPGGLAMIPRIPATAGWDTDAVLAGFLDQPIVIAGHHFDADDNLRYIEQVVDYVNGLGAVAWRNPSAIASSQYAFQRNGSTLQVRAYTRRLVLRIPEGVEAVVLERPWLAEGDVEAVHWKGSDGTAATLMCGRITEPLPAAGHTLTIASPPRHAVDPMGVRAPTATPWPTVRRTLAEARDRLYPYLPSRYRRLSQLARPEDSLCLGFP